MRVTSITYAITKQVRQFEPVRVEVTVESTGVEGETPQTMLEAARDICEDSISQALSRGPIMS